MAKGKKGPIVDVGLDKTGSKTETATHTTDFKPPRVSVVSNQIFTSHRRIRSDLVKTTEVKGWRPPTAYRSAAVRRIGEPFWLINTNPGSTITTIWGDSRPISGSAFGYAPNDAFFFTSLGVPLVSANTVNRAETEALDRLRQSKVELGASLAELRSTVSFIEDLAYTLLIILYAVREGKWHRIGRLLGIHANPKTAAQAWLAYAFGIMPMVSDISGAIDAFNTGMKQKDHMIHVSRQISSDITPLFVPTGPWREATQSGRVEELAKAVIYAKISDSTIASLSSFGALNPASAIWEGLGWSFLVDWLLPIGNFLNAMGGTVGLTFLGGSLTTRIHAELSYDILPDIAGTTLVGARCRTQYRCLATYRQVYLDWPTPWPYIKNPLSSQHTSIVASLILSGLKDFRLNRL